MTSQYRHRRTSNPASTFTSLEPGEIAVNTANRQLSVGDAAPSTIGVPFPLLAIRIFDTRASYSSPDMVTQGGIIYRAKFLTGPGNFDAVAWDPVAGSQVGPFVLRGGDTMFGHLALPTGPAASQAVRRDYVDAAIATLPTTAYVDSRDALAVLKTGSIMTGPLTLLASPTSGSHAVNRAYVDAGGLSPGALQDFAMATPPAGWLTCDGQAISRVTYAALFDKILTTWGAGDGSATFNVPNLMNRYRRHRDPSGGLSGPVGTLQASANASHYHGVTGSTGGESTDHQHYVSGNTGAADRSLDHLHSGVPSQTGTAYSGANIGTSGSTYVNPGDVMSGAADRSIDHLHSVNFWSQGRNMGHYHDFNVNSGVGSADANESRPHSATILTCIKY